MRLLIVILTTFSVLLIGCGKSSDSNGGKSKTIEKKEKPAKGYLGTVLKQPKRTEQTVNLYSIQQSIQAFKVLNGRNPHSLKELESSGYTIPPAPKGMAYRYDPMTGKIVLKKVSKGNKVK